MDMYQFTKAERRELRRLTGLAYERELSQATGALQGQFERWRAGEINVFELSELIHKFHNGVSRDLYCAYELDKLPFGLAFAVANGIVEESEVAPEILEAIQHIIDLHRAR